MKTLLLTLFFAGMAAASAQQPAIRPLLQAAAMGKTDEIRKKLPDLLVEYPDDPGVQYLHAVILEDAAKAAPLFEKIVKNYPASEWADDAEWRVVQYYAMKKDTARARAELSNFRTKYPQSEFLLAASDAVKFTVGLPKSVEKPANTPKETAVAQNNAAKSAAKTTPAAIAAAPKTPAEKTPKTAAAKATVAEKPMAAQTTRNKGHGEVKAPAGKAVIAEKTAPPQPTGNKGKADEKAAPAKPNVEKAQAPVSAFPASAPAGKTDDNDEEIEAATFEKESPAPALYSLQVGSYATKDKAEEEAKAFQQKRLRAVVGEKNVQGASKFAVYIGEYTSRAAAEKARVIVEKQCDCKPFVVPR